ncbi:hypothetical protein [Rosettibacter firmus]|uniref:hypothetical protein n=1 Tax=Rosettibacter firmus TaxID=3111522 RepID=UPI00336BE43F
MISKKILGAVTIATVALIVSSCCSCKKIGGEDNVVNGYITVVGNEPFAKLAIKTIEDKIFILECDEELEKELLKQQGNYYSIKFSESKIEMDIPVLKVISAIQIEREKKDESK